MSFYTKQNNLLIKLDKTIQIYYTVYNIFDMKEVLFMPPKYKIIADKLKNDIINDVYNDKMMLPTEQELCNKFEASRQTIRQALSILVSDGLIERKQGSGSHICDLSKVSQKSLRVIAVVTSYISDYIFPSILREIENVLSVNNCTPLLFATQNQVWNERKVLKNLLSIDNLNGVLVEGTKSSLPNPNIDLYKKLIAKNIPIVFLHSNYPELSECYSVLEDNYSGGQMLVNYLYDKGHRKIAGIFKNDDIQGYKRYSGYIDTLRNLNLQFDDSQIFWYNTEFKNQLIHNNKGIEQILPILDGCTAVICYNDEIASRLVNHLNKIGIKIPDDLSIVSFDNSQYSELSIPRITSLSHGIHNIGRTASKIMIKLLNHEKCSSELAPWTLIEKESS